MLGPNPRVVLISEFPVIQSGYRLAWELARQWSQAGERTAIIDLAPAASRLVSQLASGSDAELDSALATSQPLWSDQTHGRGLAAHRAGNPGDIDLIAQTVGQFPTADQLLRIYEQLLRSVADPQRAVRTGGPAWSTLILLSEIHGLPLDQACWQSADEILVLLPTSGVDLTHARAALDARLTVSSSGQRRLALWRERSGLLTWRRGLSPAVAGVHRRRDLPNFEHKPLIWPAEPELEITARHRKLRRAERTMARAAVRLASELNRISL